jgi:hypothetical protein
MTKAQLFAMLGMRDLQPTRFADSNGVEYFGILQSVQREDGSGGSFNVTIANQSGYKTFHLRTIG